MSEHSENPLDRRFWVGEVDARVQALLRIGLGALVIFDLADRLRDFHALYTEQGLVTGVGLAAVPFSLVHDPGTTLALFLLGFPLAVAFMLGYRTRLANVLLWGFLLGLQRRNLLVSDGGDAVVRALLFWSLFGDAGARFSLDVRLGRRPARATVPAAPLRILQLQVALIYLATFVAKSGDTWWNGTAVRYALAHVDFGRGPAGWITAHPRVCAFLTYGTLAIEAAFGPLVLSPWRTGWTRAVALLGGLALHLGIFVTMRIGVFSQVMPLSYVVFVLPRWLDRVGLPRLGATDATPAPGGRALLVGLVGLFAVVVAQSSLALRRPLVGPLKPLGLVQDWSMFAPDPPRAQVTWEASGRLADGQRVDVAAAVAPRLARDDGFAYNRWRRVRFMLAAQSPPLLNAVGRYLCRRYHAERPTPQLVSLELVATVRGLAPDAPPPERQVGFRQSCLPQRP